MPLYQPAMFACQRVFYMEESNPIYGGLYELGGLDTMAHGRVPVQRKSKKKDK